jgi:hypothetical protein
MLRTPDGGPNAEIKELGTTIAAAWLVLSNPRKSEAMPHKVARDRDRAYARLGLCKALVRYPDLLRAEPGASVEVAVTVSGPGSVQPDFNFPAVCEPRTYEVSYTRTPRFRARFDDYVAALRRLKDHYDREDRVRDYRTGEPGYRAAVERCMAEFFPPRVPALALHDELKEWRGRIYNRIAGPSPRRDPADARLFADKALYFAHVAEDLGLADVPPPVPTSASFEEMWQYMSSLLAACQKRVESDARSVPATPPAQLAAAAPARGKEYWARLRKERTDKGWDLLAENPRPTLEEMAKHCGCGKSYAIKLAPWKKVESEKAQASADNGPAPATIPLTEKMQAIASRGGDPTDEAIGDCATAEPVKLHRAAGKGRRIEGQRIRQRQRDGEED